MRLTRSTALLTLASLAALSHAALFNLPTLYSCEPASIRVLAQGNYTLEGRDLDSHKLFFRVHVDKGVRSVTWDPVDLPANSTAVFTVTDQTSASQTSVGSVQGLVYPNPTGDTACLDTRKDKGRASSKQKNMVPTIVGIVLGAFFVLVLLLVAGMMYRRRKEKTQKVEEDSVDLNHGYTGKTPAGGSYMAKLVPGLKLQDARPLPRDARLESELANYSSTRRGTHYYNSPPAPPTTSADAGYELPNYHQSQRLSRAQQHYPYPQQQWYPQHPQPQQQQQQQQSLQAQQPSPSPSAAANPFSSSPNLPRCYDLPQDLYTQPDYQRSQTSFLSKKASQ